MTSHDEAYIGCTLRTLPVHQQFEAAEVAVAINHMNAPAIEMLPAAARQALPPGHLALLTTKYWGSGGVHLTVGFLETTPADLQSRIVHHMNAWSEWSNVRFSLTAQDPQVRISRGSGGYWSYHGTDVSTIPADQPTMNLEGFAMSTPESEFVRVVRHETGHTLGFPHEHRRKEIVSRIDSAKAIAFFAANQNWDAAMTTEQVLTPFEDSALTRTALTDVNSIMCYALPGSIMTDGVAVPGGADIDPLDATFIAGVYPPTDARRPLVFGVSADGHLLTNWWNGTKWLWQDQGAPSGRTVRQGTLTTVRFQGRPLVFAANTAGRLWTNYWDGVAWRWHDLGSPPGLTVSPTALATATYAFRPLVFMLASDGHLWTNWWTGTKWLWQDQGTPPGHGVAPGVIATTATAADRPLVFVTSAEGHLWTNWWNGTKWLWQDQGTPPGLTVIPGTMTTVALQDRPLVFVLASDGHLWTNWWTGTKWLWQDQGTPPGRAIRPGALTTAVFAGRPLVFMLASDGHLWTNWWNGAKWLWQDQGLPEGHAVADGALSTATAL